MMHLGASYVEAQGAGGPSGHEAEQLGGLGQGRAGWDDPAAGDLDREQRLRALDPDEVAARGPVHAAVAVGGQARGGAQAGGADLELRPLGRAGHQHHPLPVRRQGGEAARQRGERGAERAGGVTRTQQAGGQRPVAAPGQGAVPGREHPQEAAGGSRTGWPSPAQPILTPCIPPGSASTSTVPSPTRCSSGPVGCRVRLGDIPVSPASATATKASRPSGLQTGPNPLAPAWSTPPTSERTSTRVCQEWNRLLRTTTTRSPRGERTTWPVPCGSRATGWGAPPPSGWRHSQPSYSTTIHPEAPRPSIGPRPGSATRGRAVGSSTCGLARGWLAAAAAWPGRAPTGTLGRSLPSPTRTTPAPTTPTTSHREGRALPHQPPTGLTTVAGPSGAPATPSPTPECGGTSPPSAAPVADPPAWASAAAPAEEGRTASPSPRTPPSACTSPPARSSPAAPGPEPFQEWPAAPGGVPTAACRVRPPAACRGRRRPGRRSAGTRCPRSRPAPRSSAGDRRGGGGHGPAAEHQVVVVEDARLPGGDPVARLVQVEADPAAAERHHLAADLGAVRAQAHASRPWPQAEAIGRAGPLQLHRPDRQLGALADDHALARGLDAEHVAGGRRGDAEAAALPHGEPVGALVAAERPPGGVDHRARLAAEAALQPAGGVAVGDEADVVGLRLGRGAQPEPGGGRAHLRLGHLADGQLEVGQLLRAEHVEHVGLVLGGVHRSVEPAVDHPGVVAGGERVEAERARPGEQPDDLDALVAAGAGVGGAAAGVLGGEVVDHRLLELLHEVPHVEGDADGVGDPPGVVGVRQGAASLPLYLGVRRRVGELEVDPGDVPALLGEERRRHRGVHPTAHRHQDPCHRTPPAAASRAGRTARALATAAAVSSTSASVDAQPRLKRIVSRAAVGVRPMASSTWEALTAPLAQADPAEQATPARSSSSSRSSARRPGKRSDSSPGRPAPAGASPLTSRPGSAARRAARRRSRSRTRRTVSPVRPARASAATAPKPASAATGRVPERSPRSCPPPCSSGCRSRPGRTTSAPTPVGPPSLWAARASRSAPSSFRSTPGAPAACTASQSSSAPAWWASSEAPATGCAVPTSLLAAITATSAVRPGRSTAASPSSSTLPAWSTGARSRLAPASATAHSAAWSTAWCSTAEATSWRPPGSRASTVPLTARLSASVPPEVNTTWEGAAPTRAATCSLAVSTAARAARPGPCWLDGLADGRSRSGSMAASASGRSGALAA